VNELWVKLRCDFVLDFDEVLDRRRAVDGEFVRAQLPTGDRPRGSKYGIQGGLFESWFWQRDKPPAPGFDQPPQPGPDGPNLRGGTGRGVGGAGGGTRRSKRASRPAAYDPSHVNVNTATRDALLNVNGIGPGTADRILAERREGRFRDIEDFQRRVGPNAASWERMREHITVRGREE
jgi:competence ComEA-like helix-hairpin-helix protein